MLRIARLNKSKFTPLGDPNSDPLAEYPDLVRLIRKHLSPMTASVLATPSLITADDVEWSTDLSGQPVRLDALPANEQESARKLLQDRLASISKLAEELPNINPDVIGLQDTLRRAIHYPGDDSVYVVNGQPLVAFWAHRHIDYPEPVWKASTAAPETSTGRLKQKRSRFPWRLFLSIGAIFAVLAVLGWFWLQYREMNERYQELLAQIDAAAGQCEKLEEILKSSPFLQQPDGKFLPLKLDLIGRIKSCKEDVVYRDLLAQIEAAAAQCDKLAEILETNPSIQWPDERVVALKRKLIEQVATCQADAAYRDLLARIEAVSGQCDKLEEILKTDPVIQRPDERYVIVKQKLSEQITACKDDAAYRSLLAEIEKASGQCEKLEELLNTNALLQQESGIYPQLRKSLAERIKSCKEDSSYRKLAKQIQLATGNCAELEKLPSSEALLQNPEGRFAELKRQLTESIQNCKQDADIKEIKKSIEQSASQCDKLETLLASNQRLKQAEGQFRALKEQLKKRIETCQAEQKKDPAQLCPGERPVQLAPELVVVFDASNSMNWPMGTTPESQKLRKQAQNILNQGPRNNILAALANLQADLLYNQALEIDLEKFGTANTRMTAAKNALSNMVKIIPSDVSTGLVVLTDCPLARKIGFYPPQKRNVFVRDINNMPTYGGTPLADGLKQAGAMVDGVNKASTIVVVSDGEESCRGDPCAVARNLAASKPRLTINVVDILGTGAGNCVAGATQTGRVFTARNVKDIITMTEQASSSIAAPKHCKKG
ncbi:MAG: VWA domain-containing protein [Methylococcaceae bacterium]|nr:VWA domain-containing protein [Methylococcaceae bacterium]